MIHLYDHIETDGDGASNEKPRRGQPNVPQHTLPVRVQLALMRQHFSLSQHQPRGWRLILNLEREYGNRDEADNQRVEHHWLVELQVPWNGS